VSEPRAIATGSGRSAKFISVRFVVILFREVSFSFEGLPDPLSLAVLTRSLDAGPSDLSGNDIGNLEDIIQKVNLSVVV